MREWLGVVGIAVLVVGCAGGTTTDETMSTNEAPAEEAPAPEAGTDDCPDGAWVPGAQEPAGYVACEHDDECMRVGIPGCCSTTWIALRSEFGGCYADMGSMCDEDCLDWQDLPAGGSEMRVVCVEGACQLAE